MNNKEIFANNLSYYLQLKDMTRAELARILNYPETTVANWANAINYPRIDKIQEMADFFGIKKSDLTESKNNDVGFIDLSNSISIPVVGSIPAGFAIEAVQDIIEYIDIPANWMKNNKQFVGLRVLGDSMYPLLLDGDIVVIQIQPAADTGSICACYVNGYDATLKRIELKENSITLKPENPNYPPRTYTHPGEVTILGKVIEVRRKLSK